MKTVMKICLLCFVLISLVAADDAEWKTLFDGETLNGWKFSEKEGTFSVVDGMLKVDGKRSHLFYMGETGDASFTNFEFKADIKTQKNANSGVYIHTQYQDDGWPYHGYEVQVNNSHSDWRRTAGLYGIQDVRESPAQDGEWFTMHIKVVGKHITVSVNDKVVTDYVEPDDVNYENFPGRKLGSGTFCIQGHDPKSVVYYKNIMVKELP
jgi:hypothetical protein